MQPHGTLVLEPRLAMRRITGIAISLGVLLTLRAQVEVQPRPKPTSKEQALSRSTLRVDTTLVLVPVSVNDPLGRPVSGLEKENFRLFEDKVEQTISQFAMDDEPIAVGLVFDTSGSMGEKLGRSRMAAAEFFKIANPEDEFFLVEFDNAPRLEVPLTQDTGRIESQLAFSRSRGSTALLDAIYLALHEIKRSKTNKKALLIISDGGDNHSRYTLNELNNVVVESDALIYSIGVFGRAATAEELGGPELLSRISEQTGGRLLYGDPRRPPGYCEEDRPRVTEPVCARLCAEEPAERWEIPSDTGQGDSAAGVALAARPLAVGVHRSLGIKRQGH
jgi:Ca-activated chloride channel family protein